MKHIQKFESFGTGRVDEWFGQEFVTGHEKGGKENAKSAIMSSIDSALEDMKNDPDSYADQDPTKLREFLLSSAKSDNWRGRIEQKPSGRTGLINIIYTPRASGLQNLGSAAASGTGTKLMGGY
jgi:hypothetical protein